jgi:glycosyltransferase involved in cell wall biosynthesis
MNILFLYAQAFSFTGGIQKFNRSFLKALNEISEEQALHLSAYSSLDKSTNPDYFPAAKLTGFGGRRISFTLASTIKGIASKLVILGHINLGVIGCWIKKVKPSQKLVLIAHGIEVWQTQKGYRQKILQVADEIWAVSQYTKDIMIRNNPFIQTDKVKVFPNTIDPYFALPQHFEKPAYLQQRYNIQPDAKVLIAVTRLVRTEKFKGYDMVFKVLGSLIQKGHNITYILCGKWDAEEKARIDGLLKQYKITGHVILTGFVKDDELKDHYLLADAFVMPSKKEGFGIVFIEALACGLKVIAGNKDGSVDALLNGELGMLINPDDDTQLEAAIKTTLYHSSHQPQLLQQKVVNAFGFSKYKQRLSERLKGIL